MRWASWRACCLKWKRALIILIACFASGALFYVFGGSTDVSAPAAQVLERRLTPVATGQQESTEAALCSEVQRTKWIDCHPEAGADEQACARRKCCWVPRRLARIAVGPQCLMRPDSMRYVFSELLYDDHGASRIFKLNDSDAVFRGDSEKLRVDLVYVAYHTARLRIRDPTTREFQPPLPQVNPERSKPILAYKVSRQRGALTFYSTSVAGQSLKVHLNSIFYANSTRQVAIRIPSARLFYGLKGRHGAPFANASEWSRHTFYRHDSAEAQEEEGVFSSVHPFVVIATNNSKVTLGVFLLNSNDVVMTLSPEGLATFRTSGGSLDFFFFFGTDPQSVVRQYLHIIGLPAVPSPALLLRGLRANGVPAFDGSFTSDRLLSNHEAVKPANSYTTQPAVIRDADGHPYHCHAPDKRTNVIEFVDFTHMLSSRQWLEVMQQRFNDTSMKLDTAVLLQSPRCAPNATDNKDAPAEDVPGTAILQQSTYAEVRNAYTVLLARETYRSFAKRSASIPLLLGESTFPGMGHWSGHWNTRLVSMESAIQGMLLHNILGMPVYGVATCEPQTAGGSKVGDRCGQMARPSAFFPVRLRGEEERSGKVAGLERSPQTKISEATAQANVELATLLPYTMMMLLRCSKDGDMLARPMFFEFPDDPNTHAYTTQFMYGPHLLVVPQTVPPEKRSAKLLEVYLPRGVWYHASDGRQMVSKGQPFFVPAPKGRLEAVFTRGGSIVPLSPRRQSSFSGRKFRLTVSLDADGRASGEFLQVSSKHTDLQVLHSRRYSSLHFDFVQSALIGSCLVCVNDTTLVSVRIYGLRWRPTSIDINGRQLRFNVFPTILDIIDVNYHPVQPFLITLA